MEAKNCLHCEKAFERRYAESYAEYAKRRYCSRSCGNEARRGKSPSEETRNHQRSHIVTLTITKYTNVPGTFEALWLDDEGKQIACVAYSGDQADLFRADVAKFGGDVDESLIAEITAEWVQPELPQPVEVTPVDPVEKLRQFLVVNPDVAAVLGIAK